LVVIEEKISRGWLSQKPYILKKSQQRPITGSYEGRTKPDRLLVSTTAGIGERTKRQGDQEKRGGTGDSPKEEFKGLRRGVEAGGKAKGVYGASLKKSPNRTIKTGKFSASASSQGTLTWSRRENGGWGKTSFRGSYGDSNENHRLTRGKRPASGSEGEITT